MLSKRINLAVLLLLAFLVRAVLAFSFEGTGDTGTWRLGGTTGLERQQFGMGNGTVYDGDCPVICSNWPPLTFHYMTTMRYVYTQLNPLHLPEPGFYKLLPFTADVGIVLMIYLFAEKRRFRYPIVWATVYAFHPVSLLVGGYHGQRDTIWLFFTLLTVYLLDRKDVLGAAASFATGAAIKIPPLFFAPVLFFQTKGWTNKILFAAATVFFFLLLGLPEVVVYHRTVFENVFLYAGWSGWWGLGAVVQKLALLLNDPQLPELWAPLHKLLMYAGVLAANIYLGVTARSKMTAVLGVILTVCVLSVSFASQYLVWPLPFILLLPDRYLKHKFWYTIFASYMAYNFYGRSIFFVWLIKLTQFITNRVSFLSYPMDTGIFVWILLVLLIIKLLRDTDLLDHQKWSTVFLPKRGG